MNSEQLNNIAEINQTDNQNTKINNNELSVEKSKNSSKNIIADFERDMLLQYGKKVEKLNFKAGDTIKITEKNGARLQMFEGVVIKLTNRSSRSTVLIRKVDLEKTFTIYSPDVVKIEVIKRGIVRRAKLYYLRKLSGKKAKIRERLA